MPDPKVLNAVAAANAPLAWPTAAFPPTDLTCADRFPQHDPLAAMSL